MELIPPFQLRSRLEIHCMNSSKNLMFPQYLPLCPIIPDIVIVNTLLPPPSHQQVYGAKLLLGSGNSIDLKTDKEMKSPESRARVERRGSQSG